MFFEVEQCGNWVHPSDTLLTCRLQKIISLVFQELISLEQFVLH